MPRTKKKVEIRVDAETIMDVIVVSEMVAIAGLVSLAGKVQEAGEDSALPMLARIAEDAEAIRDLICKLVWNGDGYLPYEEARPVVDQFTLRQLWDTIQGVLGAMNDTAESDTEAGE